MTVYRYRFTLGSSMQIRGATFASLWTRWPG